MYFFSIILYLVGALVCSLSDEKNKLLDRACHYGFGRRDIYDYREAPCKYAPRSFTFQWNLFFLQQASCLVPWAGLG